MSDSSGTVPPPDPNSTRAQDIQTLFAPRGGGTPFLLRDVDSAVWTNKTVVAKLHRTFRDAHREQDVAHRFQKAGVRVASPLGAEHIRGGGAVGWWEFLAIDGPASSCDTARWLRVAHDNASAEDLHYAPVGMFRRQPHPDAIELHDALAPWRRRATSEQEILVRAPRVLVHGDPNPTNIIRSKGAVVGLDFGSAGAGPRVIDVATVVVLANETGSSTPAEVLAAYGAHPDITPELMRAAQLLVSIARAQACTWVPWLIEGCERLAALNANTPYVFAPGNQPK